MTVAEFFDGSPHRTIAAKLLCPHPDDSVSIWESKLGGRIAWPADKPWPRCEDRDALWDDFPAQNNYLVPLAQFRKDQYPDILFPEQSDILQLLWCPRFHGNLGVEPHPLRAIAFWHRIEELSEVPNPMPSWPMSILVPRQCRFQPLSLEDRTFDDATDLEDAWLRTRWAESVPEIWPCIPGTKLLGWPDWEGYSDWPECRCGRRMRLLFTASSIEPYEDGFTGWHELYAAALVCKQVPPDPTGLLIFDNGKALVFYCEVCPDRPVATRVVSG